MLKNKSTFGKSNKISAFLAMLIIILIVLGCSAVKPEMPAESVTQSLVKTSLSDLADAIDKEDFKAFREKTSKDFQSTFTEAQLKTTFQSFIDKKDVIVPVLREAGGKDSKFSPSPSMREENGNYILVANGSAAAADAEVKFENEWVYRDNAWKLLKIKVDLQ